MRGLIRRGLRLEGFAALGMALAMPALAATNSLATQTTLAAETRDQSGRTQATLSVAVTGQDGRPATGAVVIQDGGKPLAGAALAADGTAKVVLGLGAGEHALRAVYQGDEAHTASFSEVSTLAAQAPATPDFSVSVTPSTLSLTAGQSQTITASITPINASSLTAPMFVTLSCSGFPDQSSCSFTPENVEIAPNATTPVASDLVVTTQATGTRGFAKPTEQNPVAFAILLPGCLVFAGLVFSVRRRWLTRLSLLAVIGLVTALGTTACAPRYNYFNHGPPYNLPTPAGTYTLTIAAQSSNGVTASTRYAYLALTVK